MGVEYWSEGGGIRMNSIELGNIGGKKPVLGKIHIYLVRTVEFPVGNLGTVRSW